MKQQSSITSYSIFARIKLVTMMLFLILSSSKGQSERYYGGNGQGYTMSITLLNQTLPVEWMSFTGKVFESGISLNWTTASELNNDYFEIQRSNNGQDFKTMGKVTGSGTTGQQSDYSFSDLYPAPGINFYRLKQVDFDGQHELSNIISVFASDAFSNLDFSLYPNPASNSVQLFIPFRGEFLVNICDPLGQLIRSMSIEGQHHKTLNITGLRSGIYLVRTFMNNMTVTNKLVIQ